MVVMKYINVLGVEYEIIKKTYTEEEAFARRSIDGYCNAFTKQIVICDMATYKGWENEDKATIRNAEKMILRHEITHAFFNESGLQDCSFAYDGCWAKNEEMIDWMAIQGVKLYKAWKEAGAV